MSSRKLVGCCTNCDEPLFEVVTQWTAPHPREGEPRRIDWQKLVDPDAVRVGFMMSDGSTCDMSFFAKCEQFADTGLARWWAKNVVAQEFDERHRAILGAPRIDVHRAAAHRRSLLKTANMVPLGVLYSVRWKDLLDARAQDAL